MLNISAKSFKPINITNLESSLKDDESDWNILERDIMLEINQYNFDIEIKKEKEKLLNSCNYDFCYRFGINIPYFNQVYNLNLIKINNDYLISKNNILMKYSN